MKKRFSPGEIVGVRYQTSGTFGGWESDWRTGIYQGASDDQHLVSIFPQMEGRSGSSEAVSDSDICPAGDLWPWLEGTYVAKRKN